MHLRIKQDYETKKKKNKKRKNETSRGLHNRISTAVHTSLYFLTLSNILNLLLQWVSCGFANIFLVSEILICSCVFWWCSWLCLRQTPLFLALHRVHFSQVPVRSESTALILFIETNKRHSKSVTTKMITASTKDFVT